MGKREVVLAIGLFLSIAGCTSSKDCEYLEFVQCLREVMALETGDFHVINEEQLKEVCNAKLHAIQCTSNFMTDCMTKGERDLFKVTTGGKLQVNEEMCREGSPIHEGYIQNIDCWGKIKEEINFCNDKFNESQRALLKSDMLDRLKGFYGCCAFEWHRNCLAKVARAKCTEEAGQFVYDVSTILGGTAQKQLCSSTYSSCHGLYGVEENEVEESEEEKSEAEESEVEDKLENITNGSTSCLNITIQFVISSFFILAHLTNKFL